MPDSLLELAAQFTPMYRKGEHLQSAAEQKPLQNLCVPDHQGICSRHGQVHYRYSLSLQEPIVLAAAWCWQDGCSAPLAGCSPFTRMVPAVLAHRGIGLNKGCSPL